MSLHSDLDMQRPYNRLLRSALYSMLFLYIGCAVLISFLSSCSTNLSVLQGPMQADDSVFTTKYSIIFIIHGDGDYLFHDTSGNQYNADEEALASAIKVAKQNPNAEVFIFHQMPTNHFLFFFPLKNGEFYYYRNGRLIANKTYWRDQEKSNFDFEVELYRRFPAKNQSEMIKMFIYCGHEIPEFGGIGYDASYPDRTFTVQDLASGLKNFTPASTKFDLMILSTCFGGTPYTIGTLGSFSHTIIASPDNLHLSYFDFHFLERLDSGLKDGDVPAYAKRFAHQSFDRLTKEIETAVTIAVYDVDRVQKFLDTVHGYYDHTVSILKGKTLTSVVTIEHCDCAELPAYVLPTMTEGIDVFYRPARFGRSKHKLNHSGWECWKY
jgi:hypothetical protein